MMDWRKMGGAGGEDDVSGANVAPRSGRVNHQRPKVHQLNTTSRIKPTNRRTARQTCLARILRKSMPHLLATMSCAKECTQL
jgi:hypothetical protein